MFDAGQHFNAVYGTAVVYHFCRLKIEILADKYYDNVNRGGVHVAGVRIGTAKEGSRDG